MSGEKIIALRTKIYNSNLSYIKKKISVEAYTNKLNRNVGYIRVYERYINNIVPLSKITIEIRFANYVLHSIEPLLNLYESNDFEFYIAFPSSYFSYIIDIDNTIKDILSKSDNIIRDLVIISYMYKIISKVDDNLIKQSKKEGFTFNPMPYLITDNKDVAISLYYKLIHPFVENNNLYLPRKNYITNNLNYMIKLLSVGINSSFIEEIRNEYNYKSYKTKIKHLYDYLRNWIN